MGPEAQHKVPSVEVLHKITPDIVEDFWRLSPQLDQVELPNRETLEARLREATDPNNENSRVVVIWADGHVQATATGVINSLWKYGREGSIHDVLTDGDHEGRGYATLLMAYLGTWFEARDVTSINLTSNPSRKRARRMYERQGFSLRETGAFRRVLRRSGVRVE